MEIGRIYIGGRSDKRRRVHQNSWNEGWKVWNECWANERTDGRVRPTGLLYIDIGTDGCMWSSKTAYLLETIGMWT